MTLTWTASSNAANYQVFRNGVPLGSLLPATQLTLDNSQGVSAGQTYGYFVRASNSNGTKDTPTIQVSVPSSVCGNTSLPGAFSVSGNPYCNTTPPAAPAVMLTWTSSSNATSYQVFRNGSPLGGLLPATQLTFDNNANVAAGQSYSYFVRATNANGFTDTPTIQMSVPSSVCSNTSLPGTFSVGGNPYCNTTPPTAPAVMLTWTVSSNATTYQVFRNGSAYSSLLSASQLTFDNNANVSAGQGYSYFIRATNANGFTDTSTIQVSVPGSICGNTSLPGAFSVNGNPYCNTTPPAAPAVMLIWTSSSNVTTYQVFRNGSAYSSLLSASQLTFDNNANVAAGQTYSYFIRATNVNGFTDTSTIQVSVPGSICGNTSLPGAFSVSGNPYCNTTPPAAPAVMLTWTSSSNATTYQVFRNGSAYSSLLSASQLTFDNNANVSAGQTYSYFIRATNPNGFTDTSTIQVAVPSSVCGNPSLPGAFSVNGNPYCNTTPPTAPAVMLTWTSSSNATTYQLFRNGSAYSSLLSASQLTFDNNANVAAGQNYSYFVRAANANGFTDTSTIQVFVPGNICGGLPDLTISSGFGPVIVSKGTSLVLPVTVTKTGGSLTKGTYVYAKALLSTDSLPSADDVQLWGATTVDFENSVLNAAGFEQKAATLVVPSTVPSGAYWLILVVDPVNFDQESDESNNTVAYPGLVVL